MYLGNEEILRRIREEGLIEGLGCEAIQGSGVDLRIDKLYVLTSGARLGADERRLPDMEERDGEIFLLKPGGYYLCSTMENVKMPADLIAFILPRSTLFRCGVSLESAVVDPGYQGHLTIGLKNQAEREFALGRGARIAQIVFSKIHGSASTYRGRYQGGKVR